MASEFSASEEEGTEQKAEAGDGACEETQGLKEVCGGVSKRGGGKRRRERVNLNLKKRSWKVEGAGKD